MGRVTAYEISPYLECGVGFVLFDSPRHTSATGLTVADRNGEPLPAELVELPFYDADKNIPRGLPAVDGAVDRRGNSND